MVSFQLNWTAFKKLGELKGYSSLSIKEDKASKLLTTDNGIIKPT